MICDGEEVAILSLGPLGNNVVQACGDLNIEGIHPAHFDMRFVKPLDEALLQLVFSKFDKIITIEDGCLPGGFGSAILEFMADNDYRSHVVRLGIPDRVVEHGEPEQLHKECGYDVESIKQAVHKILEKEVVKY